MFASADHRSMQSQAEAISTLRPRAPRGLWDGMGPRGRGGRNVTPRVEDGFDALADAFEAGAVRASGSTLMETLLERKREIPVAVTMNAIRALVVLACRQTGETPRTLLEAEIDHAPPDDFWRAEITVDPDPQTRPGRG
jgi:hypothetical protein